MRLLSGIIAGALAGIAAGVLMAPDRGDSTRKKLNKESSRVRTDVEKSLNEGIYNLLDSVSQAIDDYSKRSQKSLKQAKKKKRYINF
ncbi:YtxH domain-containing protein [Tunicatimonas pelagia]|uniref:YtxH domain-containing protein n=1 Tax=Tunicatimonas pelagia TaxID=931531 RepID=UPI002665EAB5|nr:YtxH domain-containing protein [Tunicatimonas pelagia]WKN44360.1 YtxH domain-containing protein [Tunicatimonas pelagia]